MITAEDIRASINKTLEILEGYQYSMSVDDYVDVEAELLKLLEELDDVE